MNYLLYYSMLYISIYVIMPNFAWSFDYFQAPQISTRKTHWDMKVQYFYDVYRRIRRIQRVPRDSNFSDEWLPSTLWIYLNKNEDDVPQWQSYMPTKVTIDWLDSKWCPVWTFNEYLYWLISEKAFWNTTILKFLQFFLYWSKHFQWMCFKKCFIYYFIHSMIN